MEKPELIFERKFSVKEIRLRLINCTAILWVVTLEVEPLLVRSGLN